SVRETSVMILPAFLLYALLSVLAGRESLKQRLQEHRQLLLKAVVLFAVSCAIGLLPILLNSAKITELNEPFKARDTGEVVLLSNINHIQTVSFQNVFESTGRYRPASGSLPQFWIVMNELFSKLPFFAWLAIAGLAFGLWK